MDVLHKCMNEERNSEHVEEQQAVSWDINRVLSNFQQRITCRHLKPTSYPTMNYLQVFASILIAELRRRQGTISLARRDLKPKQLLRSKITGQRITAYSAFEI